MRSTKLLWVVLALAVGLSALAQQPAGPEGGDSTAELVKARAAADALASELRTRLGKAMASGGAVEAVKVCSEVAQAVSEQQTRDGVFVRRVTEKARNPKNRPDPWESKQLERLAAAHASGQLPAEVYEWEETWGFRAFRYMHPIVVGSGCLGCHGDPETMKPEVAALIRQHYPEDQATGYHEGDFRGAISVVVHATPLSRPGPG